jgi:predicted nicotinamide N-methyase
MATIFDEQPDFIDKDPRNLEGYNIGWTAQEQEQRYQAWLPPQYISGKRILDLGCCGAAVGGYVMSHGAAHYTGIECDPAIYQIAVKNMAQYHSGKSWQIDMISAEDLLATTSDHYDIVIASGIIHGVTDVVTFLHAMSQRADLIVVESIHPSLPFMHKIFEKLAPHLTSEEDQKWAASLIHALEYSYAMIEYSDTGRMIRGDTETAVSNILRPLPSMAALKLIMNRLGFVEDIRPYIALKKAQPSQFGAGKRFAMAFLRHAEAKAMSFRDIVARDEAQTIPMVEKP